MNGVEVIAEERDLGVIHASPKRERQCAITHILAPLKCRKRVKFWATFNPFHMRLIMLLYISFVIAISHELRS